MSTTESSSHYDKLEAMSTHEMLVNINTEDKGVPEAIEKCIPAIEKLVDALVEKMKMGGRLFYIGAGTSGRLGIVDASEIPPTFGMPHGRVVGIMAGGDKAIRKAVEFAEDDIHQAWKDLEPYKINKDDFYFEIILEYDEISPKQLVEEEKKIHIELNVKNSEEYFNRSVATSGWVSVPRTDDTKKKMSRITKNYWDQNSQKALERRKELSERNRKIKSKEMQERWKNPTDKMLKALEKNKSKLKNKSEEWIMNIKNAERKPKTAKKVFGCGTIYDSAVDASKVIGINPVNIRRRCRLENYQDWYYLN